MTITREMLSVLRPLMVDALNKATKPHGVVVKIGSISFREHELSFRVTGAVIDAAKGDSDDAIERAEWERSAARFGLKKEDFGAKFEYMADEYVIVGIAPRSKKNPLLVKRNGKTYKFPIKQALAALGREIPSWMNLNFTRSRREF